MNNMQTKMTKAEAGRKGGLVVKNRPKDYFAIIGRLGGKAKKGYRINNPKGRKCQCGCLKHRYPSVYARDTVAEREQDKSENTAKNAYALQKSP